MQTDRDRLIEVIDNFGDNISLCDVCKAPIENCDGCKNEQLADYLLANGVFLLPEDLRGTQDFSISAFIEAMQMYKEKDRYIKTPCKVGDTIYKNILFKDGHGDTVPQSVVGFHLGKFPHIRGRERKQYIIVYHEVVNTISHIDIKQIGKTVFLTKEEAEEKLKELKENECTNN